MSRSSAASFDLDRTVIKRSSALAPAFRRHGPISGRKLRLARERGWEVVRFAA